MSLQSIGDLFHQFLFAVTVEVERPDPAMGRPLQLVAGLVDEYHAGSAREHDGYAAVGDRWFPGLRRIRGIQRNDDSVGGRLCPETLSRLAVEQQDFRFEIPL